VARVDVQRLQPGARSFGVGRGPVSGGLSGRAGFAGHGTVASEVSHIHLWRQQCGIEVAQESRRRGCNLSRCPMAAHLPSTAQQLAHVLFTVLWTCTRAASVSNICSTSNSDGRVAAGMQGMTAGSSKLLLLQESPPSPRPPPYTTYHPSRQRLLRQHRLLLVVVLELLTLASTVAKPGASFGRHLDSVPSAAVAHCTSLTVSSALALACPAKCSSSS
jgi:hypothetical protein